MPKSYYQSISQLMACDEFCTFVNEILYLTEFSINSDLSLVSSSLVDVGIP